MSMLQNLKDCLRTRRAFIRSCKDTLSHGRERFDRRVRLQEEEVERKRQMLQESLDVLESIKLERQTVLGDLENIRLQKNQAEMEVVAIRFLLTNFKDKISQGRTSRKVFEQFSTRWVSRLVQAVMKQDTEQIEFMLKEYVEGA